jgi:tetratricopeptide (TPR) repeat protein
LSVLDRCLIAGRALWFYAGKLAWPANFMFIYPRWHVDPGVVAMAVPVDGKVMVTLLWSLRGVSDGGRWWPCMARWSGAGFAMSTRCATPSSRITLILASAGLIARCGGLTKIVRPCFRGAGAAAAPGRPDRKQSAIYADTKTRGRTRWPRTLTGYPQQPRHILESEGDVEGATSHYEEAIRRNPITLKLTTISNHLQEGPDRGRHPRIPRSHPIKPAYATAYSNLGTALGARGRTTSARTISASIHLNPFDGLTHYNFGIVLFKTRRIDDAISELQQAVRLLPDYASARINLGIALGSSGRLDEAIAQFQEAVRLKPDFPQARGDLGTALLAKGQVDEAIHQFREAIRLNPNYPEAFTSLSRALELKDCQGADLEVLALRHLWHLYSDLTTPKLNLADSVAR